MSQNHIINHIKKNPAKIYLNDYKPSVLTKKFIKLDEYFRRTEKYTEILSPDGIFNIENEKMYKLKPIDKEIITHSFENFELLLDDSYFEREIVLSQIPYDNISFAYHRFYYSQEPIGKNTFLIFVIEGVYENNNENKINDNKDNKDNKDKYLNFTPTNFYFLMNENFDNILIKKELNVFLSILK
uniref:Uncharacterized protein n=1 Tax=viral metagenome TaxID=1070528 RepID=A0A6C0D7G1_9ZZZZ